MNAAAVAAGARSDSHRYYDRELRLRFEALAAERDSLLDLVADLDTERFYDAPETKATLRTLALALGKAADVLLATRAALPRP